MKQVYEDLWQSELYSSGILNTHAYLLTRPNGNILFYNTGSVSDLEHISELGGIKYQLLTHRDEVGKSLQRIKEQFSSKLGIGILEAPYAQKHTSVDIKFETTDTQLEDIEVYFTPGHSEGSICYCYQSPYGKTYLFSGDSIFMWDRKWSTFVIKGFNGTNEDMVNSLKKLRELKPNAVLSSGFIGTTSYEELTNDEWITAIDSCIVKLV